MSLIEMAITAAGIYLAIGAIWGAIMIAGLRGWVSWGRMAESSKEAFDVADQDIGETAVNWWLFAYTMFAWPHLLTSRMRMVRHEDWDRNDHD